VRNALLASRRVVLVDQTYCWAAVVRAGLPIWLPLPASHQARADKLHTRAITESPGAGPRML